MFTLGAACAFCGRRGRRGGGVSERQRRLCFRDQRMGGEKEDCANDPRTRVWTQRRGFQYTTRWRRSEGRTAVLEDEGWAVDSCFCFRGAFTLLVSVNKEGGGGGGGEDLAVEETKLDDVVGARLDALVHVCVQGAGHGGSVAGARLETELQQAWLWVLDSGFSVQSSLFRVHGFGGLG